MSLINQMLQDLDKRRASSHEREVLPNNVRVLPQSAKPRMRWWIPAAGGALVVAAAASWFLLRPTPVALDVSTKAPAAPPVVVAAPQSPAAPVVAPPPIATAAVIAADPPGPSKPTSAPPVQPEPRVAVAEPEPPRMAPAQPEPARTALPSPVDGPRAASPRRSSAPVQARAEETSARAAPQIDKRTQQLTPPQLAENEYRSGTTLLSQGRGAEAQQKFRLALQQHADHVGARQALFGLLLEAKKTGEAEQLLQEGLQMNVHQAGFAMALARMQVDRGDTPAAVVTLQKSAPSAVGSPDYLAFLAALLQRQSRHVEAVDHYTAALAMAPNSGVWQMGMGISLQALGRTAEARDAFRRAQASRALNPELQAFVGDRLRQLQ